MDMSLRDLSLMLEPEEDGDPNVKLRTGVVVTVTPALTVALNGVIVPALALGGLALTIGDIVTMLTRTSAPPLVLGAAATSTPGAWIDATYATGWSAFAANRGLQYRKIGDTVEVRGAVVSGGGATSLIWVAPVGFRPGSDRYSFQCTSSSTPVAATVNIVPGGNLTTAVTLPVTFLYVVGSWSVL